MNLTSNLGLRIQEIKVKVTEFKINVKVTEFNNKVEKFLRTHTYQGQSWEELNASSQEVQDLCDRINFPSYYGENSPLDRKLATLTISRVHDLTNWLLENKQGNGLAAKALQTKIDALKPILKNSDFDRHAPQAFDLDRLLVEGDGINTPLTLAIRKGDVKRVTLLLDSAVNVQLGDRTGLSPLQIAAIQGNVPIIELLCQNSALSNRSYKFTSIPVDYTGTLPEEPLNNERRLSALGLARKYHRTEAVAALVKSGATIIYHGWEKRVAFQRKHPIRASMQTSEETATSREVFAAKLLSHSLKLTGDLSFSGGKLRLEGSMPEWLCWEMLESFHAFIQEYPGRIQAKEIKLIVAQLSRGGQDRDMLNFEKMTTDVHRSTGQGPVVPLHYGYDGHTAEWVFLNQHLIISNKGGASRKVGEVYKINTAKVTSHRVKGMLCDLKADEASKYTMWLELLPRTFHATSDDYTRFIESTYPVEQLGEEQKGGFCTWDSVETSLFFTLAMTRFEENFAEQPPSPEAVKELQDTFTAWVRFTQLFATQKYLNQVDQGEIPFNPQLATMVSEKISTINWSQDMQEWVHRLQERIKERLS